MPPSRGLRAFPAGAPPRRRARRGRQMRVRREAPPRRDAAEPWRSACAARPCAADAPHAPPRDEPPRRNRANRQALRQAARSLRFSTWGKRPARRRDAMRQSLRLPHARGRPGDLAPRASDAATLPPPDARPQRGEPAGFCRRRGESRDPRGGSARVRAGDGLAPARTSRRDAPQRGTAGLRARASQHLRRPKRKPGRKRRVRPPLAQDDPTPRVKRRLRERPARKRPALAGEARPHAPEGEATRIREGPSSCR